MGDAAVIEAVVARLGYAPTFRGQKYRAEYKVDQTTVTIDETPMGVFVEIEGTPAEIERIARLLGRTPADYELGSYPALWERWRREKGVGERDMVMEKER